MEVIRNVRTEQVTWGEGGEGVCRACMAAIDYSSERGLAKILLSCVVQKVEVRRRVL